MKLRTLLWVNLVANDAFAFFNQRLDKGTETACAFVSRSASIVRARSPFATPTVRAQVAYDCLNSVPLNASAAVALVEAILPYMEWQSAGVRSIAMGGRPNKDPIQAVGGTRGALVLQYGFILDLVERALSSKSASQNLTALAAYSSLPQDRSTRATVNAADIILPNHLEDGVPAQFLYEEADCRLFYEPAMISDVRAVWKTAAEVVWGGGKCVAGSLKQKNEGLAARKRKSKESSIEARSEQRVSLETIGPFSLWNERPSDPDLGMDVPR